MRMLKLLAAVTLALVMTTAAEARKRITPAHDDCNILWPCEGVSLSKRGQAIVKAMGGFGSARPVYERQSRQTPVRPRVRVVTVTPKPKPSMSLDGVLPVLADKVREIVSTCGSSIWSTVRHTYIAGTRTISQHASGAAVDVHGNPSCIYAMLKGWPGGYTTDYSRVNHVHISYGGREHGLRFAHGGSRRHYAHRRHHQYAMVR